MNTYIRVALMILAASAYGLKVFDKDLSGLSKISSWITLTVTLVLIMQI